MCHPVDLLEARHHALDFIKTVAKHTDLIGQLVFAALVTLDVDAPVFQNPIQELFAELGNQQHHHAQQPNLFPLRREREDVYAGPPFISCSRSPRLWT